MRIASLSVLLTLASGSLSMAQPGDPPPTLVEVETAERGTAFKILTVTGSVAPVMGSRLASVVEGQVESVLADEGDFVTRGDALLEIVKTPINHRIDEARGNAALEKAEYDELANGTRQERINAEEGQVREAEARLRLAEAEERRLKSLISQNAVSESEYDIALANLEEARATLEVQRAEFVEARDGARKEVLAAAYAEYEAAEAAVALLEYGLSRHTIRAPFNGVIGEKMSEAGQWVQAGTEVFTLASIDPLRVEVSIPESDFSNINVGTEASIRFDAFPDEVITVPVTAKVPIANPTTRTFPIHFDIDNKDLKYAIGMVARVTFRISDEKSEDVILIPKDALVLQPGGQRTLWRVVEESGGLSVQKIPVRTGREFDDKVALISGDLEAGQRVVTRGNERLFPGTMIEIIDPNAESAAGDGGSW